MGIPGARRGYYTPAAPPTEGTPVTYQNEKALRFTGLKEDRLQKGEALPPTSPPGQVATGTAVGKRTPLVDARRKVTGEGQYTDDFKMPGMLVARILRSPHPHARILSIDASAALALPGVKAVVTGKDAPGHFGVLPISQDETAMAVDKTHHVGEAVAAVAADDEAIADRALRLIRVEYQVLPSFLHIDDSLRELRPGEEKIHPHCKGNTNIHKQVEQVFGDPDQGLAQSEVVIRETMDFAGVTHAFTEPMATIAYVDADERLNVISAQQVPHYLHLALAKVLDLPHHRIRVVRPLVGGGFGGKSDPFPHEVITALLAIRTGRPVKLRFDREEVFYSNHGRHPTRTQVELGVDKEGKVKMLGIDAAIDGGAFGSFGVVTSYYNGVLSHGPYRLPSFRYRGRRVYTNKPCSGAMRGHGSVNSRFAYEVALDMAAERLRMDPVEIRLKNVLLPFTTTENHFRITSNGIRECIERAAERSGWTEKKGRLPHGRGIGIGCGFYISGSALPIHKSRLPQATVHLKVDFDGGVTAHTLAAEIGQGSDTMVAQCIAEVLALPMDRIRVRSSDTDLAPVDLGSYSSRVTFMVGNAARRAAEQIRGELTVAAGRLTGYSPEVFEMREGMVWNRSWPERSVSYEDALEEALADKGALIARGAYQSPPMGGTFKGAGAGLSPTYSFSAFVCETEVDPETGVVTPLKVWAAHDCGKALNPLAVEGQLEGSIHMGLGQALMEEMPYIGGGLLNPNLLDYRCLSSRQMPDVEVIIVESQDPEGPWGAKECGEGGLAPILPALANAVHDAVGVRILELPMTQDVVWKALQRKARAEASSTRRSA